MRGQIKLFKLQMNLEKYDQLRFSRIMTERIDLKRCPPSGEDISLPKLALISGR